MDYIKRDIEKIILETSRSFSAVLICGPRQIGKTTTLRHLMDEKRTYVTLDDLEARRIAQTDPEMFLTLYPAPVLIDEVQYAPQLFSYIKIAIDNGAAPGSYWMTGSQVFHLMKLAQESLAGRTAILYMSSLSQHEIYGSGDHKPLTADIGAIRERVLTGTKTDVTGVFDRIWKGSMPGIISGKHRNINTFYSSYIRTYIQRDIGDMVDRINALLFADFIRAAACRAGQVLNIHSIAADIGVSDDTAKRWLLLLERSGVIFYLRPYSGNILKRAIKSPKLYFFDTGLVAYLTKHSSPEILMNGAINGAILENYVVAETIKSYTNNGRECYIYYYRNKDNVEIDMIIENDTKLQPFEIKKTSSPGSSLPRKLKILDNGNIKRSTGAILCTKEDFSAVDKTTLIIPIWMI